MCSIFPNLDRYPNHTLHHFLKMLNDAIVPASNGILKETHVEVNSSFDCKLLVKRAKEEKSKIRRMKSDVDTLLIFVSCYTIS